jgi:hypothetical protein
MKTLGLFLLLAALLCAEKRLARLEQLGAFPGRTGVTGPQAVLLSRGEYSRVIGKAGRTLLHEDTATVVGFYGLLPARGGVGLAISAGFRVVAVYGDEELLEWRISPESSSMVEVDPLDVDEVYFTVITEPL